MMPVVKSPVLPLAAIVVLAASPVQGHEAWLLTPSEVEALSRAPMPALFTSQIAMLVTAIAGGMLAWAALIAEDRFGWLEQRLARPIEVLVADLGPLFVRVGLALMLGLGALGGLPRAGTELWSTPVLFVPDMQLALVPGWDWLVPVCVGLAALLATGLATRLAAVGVLGLAGLGLGIFGVQFLSYAPHFIAPALILIAFGPGSLSVDRLLGINWLPALSDRQQVLVWRGALFLIGGTFVYLGITHKLLQPTLLIAILDHGDFPTFGVPIEAVALVMTGVEIVAGLLLAMGRLVRPVALFLMGAFTFFAVMLGETPLFHANLYGAALMLFMAGSRARPGAPKRPRPVAPVSLGGTS